MNSYSTRWWSLLLIYRPHEDERLSWPCWLTYSGRFTHINGYPSAAGPVQASVSSPVRDRRSTTELHHQSHQVMWDELQGWLTVGNSYPRSWGVPWTRKWLSVVYDGALPPHIGFVWGACHYNSNNNKFTKHAGDVLLVTYESLFILQFVR